MDIKDVSITFTGKGAHRGFAGERRSWLLTPPCSATQLPNLLLGSSLATAMLNVMLDVGDKVNQELKAYGANITVVPKENSVIDDIYELEGDDADEIKSAYLKEDELGKIKTIFYTRRDRFFIQHRCAKHRCLDNRLFNVYQAVSRKFSIKLPHLVVELLTRIYAN